ncbi:hypothetical protein M0M57_12555 [Flavobacterium azooxidireducens]|uniref:Uncharacterized protein n=1 Tax=Flavobacterium azooxidireducens TaxID=1871076 RepID=A0ABY4KFA2_9FLAO|nr:hypothetical protein [Flavobacterium azooxidireducens]UPQ78448.1 hypothetical protein M0M57_12555 [Flavobacterium azooxidireducens]
MKVFFISFFLIYFSLNNLFSQSLYAEKIEFNHGNSIVLDSFIRIEIYALSEDQFLVISTINNVTEQKKIKYKEYKKVFDAILKIQSKDLLNENRVGLDGSDTSIKIGGMFNNYTEYNVWGLDKNDKNNSYKDFFHATELLLNIVGKKIEELK